MTLASLQPGQAGTIIQLDGARGFRRRLMELGLVPGTSIRLVGVAPLGDPLEIEVLSLRRADARGVALR